MVPESVVRAVEESRDHQMGDDGMRGILFCNCGWESEPGRRVTDFQEHLDRVTAAAAWAASLEVAAELVDGIALDVDFRSADAIAHALRRMADESGAP